MFNDDDKPGVLFEGREAGAAAAPRPATASPAEETAQAGEQAPKSGSSRIAFGGLFLFTLMLYVRPNDLVPGAFTTFQIVKIVAIFTVVAYVGSQIAR